MVTRLAEVGPRVRAVLADAAALLIALMLAAPVSTAASLPPRYRFQTLESGKIRVHFHREVESPARLTMGLALEILPRLEGRYRVRVPGLDIVVHDASDSPNGLASSFPYPYVEIRTAAPNGADSGPTESWLRMVVTHELTHIVHIEKAGGIYGLGRRVFGRAPFLFPDALQPTWFVEGLAVREETRGTAFGRGRHTFTRMLVDEAARSGQLDRLDQATLGLDLWPFGNAPYLFGEEFLAWLETRYGESAARDIAFSHASSIRPYRDDQTFRKVTGSGLQALWSEFAKDRAGGIAGRPPPSMAGVRRLTARGTIQTSPRLSPDGETIAYTSRTLDRLGEIRLMKNDGAEDRRLATRISGSALSWSRDGRSIVFDETNPVRRFESRSDLHIVDVATGGRRRLTRGLRASDPDYGPEGEAGALIVFVERLADRSELCLLNPKDGGVRALTASAPGVQWSHPRFSPNGDAIVASRLDHGFVDLILVDPAGRTLRELTHDRALDADPAWVDDDTVIFRSDREGGMFGLFLIQRDGSGVRRTGEDVINAFAPEVGAPTKTLFYATYSAQGYDLASRAFEPGADVPAFTDPFPDNAPDPPPFTGTPRPYSAVSALAPRFVTPFTEVVSNEWRLGLATAAFDPLFRLAYGVAGSVGTQISKPNALAYVRYDRFTPTFTALFRAESSPRGVGRRDLSERRLSMDWPIEISALRSQELSLTLRRRRETTPAERLDTGIAAIVWGLDSTKTYPRSVSPQDGVRLRVAATRELRALGSDLDFGKLIVDVRAYLRAGSSVLASRVGGGWTFGPRPPGRAFAVGGLLQSSLLDPVGDQPALLRGYKDPAAGESSRFGTRLAFANLDWRIPLARPQRGVRALPFFVRRVHFSVAFDAAVISTRGLNLNSARVGASLGLGTDLFLAHRFPVTIEGGIGRGLTRDGLTVPWFSIGLPF